MMNMKLMTPLGVLILDWALCFVSTCFVFFRLWIRIRRLWTMGASDVFILISWVCVLAVCVFNTVIYMIQLGKAQPGVPRTTIILLLEPAQIIVAAKIAFAMNITYVFLLWSVKASFLALLAPPYRCLPKKYRILFIGSVVFSVATFLAVLALNIFWCIPVKRNWSTKWGKDSYCTPALQEPVFVAQFALHMITDLNILILPLFVIQSLGMQSRREYAGIFFVFLIGCFSIAASCTRFAVVYRSGTFNVMGGMSTAMLEVWTPVEQNAAVIAACLPSMRVLIRGAAKSVRASSAKRTDKEYESTGESTRSHSSKISAKLKEHAKRLSSRSGAESEIELGKTWHRDVSTQGTYQSNTSSCNETPTFVQALTARPAYHHQHSASITIRNMYHPPNHSDTESAEYPQHQIIDDYIDPSQIAIAR